MSVFYGIEHFFGRKATTPRNVMLFSAVFISFAVLGIFVCFVENAYLGCLSFALISLLAFFLIKELKQFCYENDMLIFQKNIVMHSYDASSSAFFVFSKTGKLIFYNKLAMELFPNNNIKNIDDFTTMFADYKKVLPAILSIKQTIENGMVSHIDIPIILDNNTSAYWRIFASPVSGFSGYTVWSITDLTPSFENMDILEANSNFLLDVMNSLEDIVFTIDYKGDISFCNKNFADLMGMKIEAVNGCNILDLINKHESSQLPSAQGAWKLTKSIPSRIVFNSSKGNKVNTLVKQIWISKSGDLRAFSVTKQTNESAKLADALDTTKLYFEKIFEDAPVGIALTEGAETLTACNKTFRELTGYFDSDMTSTSFLSLVADDYKDTVREKLHELVNAIYSEETPFEIQLSGKSKNKTVVIYANQLEICRLDKTKQRGLVLYFVDVSDRKELQNQFVQSQKMQAIGQLAGGVAHDFNNLLTAIIGYCDLLLGKYTPIDQTFADVMQIKQNANRASNLVRQLLAFSRQQTLQPKIFNVTDLVVELSNLLNRLIGANIELGINHGKDIGCIKVDQMQFEQVIINLVVNARDAMPNGGTLTIKTENLRNDSPKFLRGETMPAGNYVVIHISDTGTGIPDDVINRIFDPFFSTKEKGAGTGLGLSTVYGIVDQTGGFINVESSVGHGTIFSLYFPMCDSCANQAKYENHAIDQVRNNCDLTGHGKILLVEDEDAVRMFSSRALRDKGYTVIEAQNGQSALDYLKKEGEEIDLMITDVVMPKMDGPTLIKYVKELSLDLKVIFISGYTEDNFRKSLENDSNVCFLAKPFNLKELSAKVKEVLS